MFAYQHDMDTNGVLYHLGYDTARQLYVNPMDACE